MNISRLYQYWQWLADKPAGCFLFNTLIRFINPYTGSLKARVVDIQKGYARVELKERRAIRNHLDSIHAIALANLGEFASGLALISLFDDNIMGIPVDIHIQFFKKARGHLFAESTTRMPEFMEETEHWVMAEIKNTDNELVSRTEVKWKLRYRQQE